MAYHEGRKNTISKNMGISAIDFPLFLSFSKSHFTEEASIISLSDVVLIYIRILKSIISEGW